MVRKKHILKCPAPICMSHNGNGWKKELVWYPGEAVCDKRPFTKIQKTQKQINDLYRKKQLTHPDHYFTPETLDKIIEVTPRIRGRDPDIK